MKLVFVIYSLSAGGAERVMSQLVNAFSEKYDVTLLTLCPEVFYPLNHKVKHIVCKNPQGGVQAVLKRLKNLREMLKILQPDLIISFMTEMNVHVLLATRRLKIPVIVSERIDPKYYLPFPFAWFRKLFYPFARRVVYLHSSFASTKNAVIIPNFVQEQTIYKASHQKQAKYLVTIGRLCDQKDHKTLIHAISRVAQHFPETILNIYGQGPLQQTLEQLIRSLNLQNNIFLCGLTKNSLDVLERSDLLIFPSLYEGFPNTVAEAMSVGLPVITTNIPGNIVPYECVPIQNPDALAKRICTLIPDQKERTRLGQVGRNAMKAYAPEKIIGMWEHLICSSQKSTVVK